MNYFNYYLLADTSEAEGIFLFCVIVIVALAAYLLPSIIAVSRGHSATAGIIIVNVVFGWTIFGYVVSLIWSFTDSSKQQPTQVVFNNPGIPSQQHSLQQPPQIPQQEPRQLNAVEVPASTTLKEQLAELKELRDENLISEEEFQTKRTKLLS